MQPLWTPSRERVARERLTTFKRDAGAAHGREFDTYEDLYRFSIDHPAEFWNSVWELCGVRGEMGERVDVTVLRGSERLELKLPMQ